MIIIGEKINASRKTIAEALAARDEATISQVAVQQCVAGADYLDVNGGDPRGDRETQNMEWLMDIVQAHTDLPVAIDSANPQAIRVGLQKARRRPIVNSISLEASRLGPLLDLVGGHDCMVVGLLMSDQGAPQDIEGRRRNAADLIARLTGVGKKLEDIIIDVCFFPISADASAGRNAIDAIAAIKRDFPGVHVGGGVSNVSYGLPKRRFINQAMLIQAIYAGMDACIVDPCAEGVVASIYAAQATAGGDEYCMGYVGAERDGKLM